MKDGGKIITNVNRIKGSKKIVDNEVRQNAMEWDVPSKLIVRTPSTHSQKNQHADWGVPILKGNRQIVFNERKNDVLNINVETWADVDSKTYMCWGDFWVKQKLLAAFEKLGVNTNVAPQDADVTIYLWGSPFPQRHSFPYMYNPKTHNIMWFYSHPDKMTESEMQRYDVIFCLSKNYIKVLNKRGWHKNIIQEPLLPCSDFTEPDETEIKDDIDVLFVGNSRGGLEYGRKAVKWLDPPPGSKVRIYGHKWYRQPQFNKWFAKTYWDYEKLNQLYKKAKIVLIDGHDDMNKYGFVQVKVIDVLKSGGFPLAFHNIGIKQIFGNILPTYSTKRWMNELIMYYLDHDDERNGIIKAAQEIVIDFTYEKTAKILLDYIKTVEM